MVYTYVQAICRSVGARLPYIAQGGVDLPAPCGCGRPSQPRRHRQRRQPRHLHTYFSRMSCSTCTLVSTMYDPSRVTTGSDASHGTCTRSKRMLHTSETFFGAEPQRKQGVTRLVQATQDSAGCEKFPEVFSAAQNGLPPISDVHGCVASPTVCFKLYVWAPRTRAATKEKTQPPPKVHISAAHARSHCPLPSSAAGSSPA